MKTTKRIVTVVLIALMAFVTLTLTGCGKEKKAGLVGSWDYSGFVYKFNEDKTGSYSVYSTEMPFTYEDKGDKVSIKYENATVASEFEYRIEDNKLIIKDSFGKDVVYTKK